MRGVEQLTQTSTLALRLRERAYQLDDPLLVDAADLLLQQEQHGEEVAAELRRLRTVEKAAREVSEVFSAKMEGTPLLGSVRGALVWLEDALRAKGAERE